MAAESGLFVFGAAGMLGCWVVTTMALLTATIAGFGPYGWAVTVGTILFAVAATWTFARAARVRTTRALIAAGPCTALALSISLFLVYTL